MLRNVKIVGGSARPEFCYTSWTRKRGYPVVSLRGIIEIRDFRFLKMPRYPSSVFFRDLQEYAIRFSVFM